MTSCERATNLFGRAWDDELTAPEREGLEGHFAACAPCRREYDELARTLELVQALPRPQVDDDFARRVLLAAETREREARSARRRVFALPQGWSWPAAPAFGRPALALAATFVVAIGIGAFLLARPVDGPGTASDPPAVATTTTRSRVEAPTPSADLAAPEARPRTVPTAEPATIARVEPSTTAPRRGIARPVPATAALAAEVPSDLDSLFDHSADVELVLDPVQLRRERGRGWTPSSPTVKGEAASITF